MKNIDYISLLNNDPKCWIELTGREIDCLIHDVGNRIEEINYHYFNLDEDRLNKDINVYISIFRKLKIAYDQMISKENK